ncbi:Hypothetical predicted protein [Paramuricea clavata]|uniref:Uncharacterized protein n=1 Tax=Paramuricea clavata TaxID=317549 RepID=A0A7D9D8C1_PARCT|nr:Hypothetical predicted protein [Paramuricea clavata]
MARGHDAERTDAVSDSLAPIEKIFGTLESLDLSSKRDQNLLGLIWISTSKRCGLPPNDLLLVYFSMVRSILEYACPVWHTMLPKCLGDKIEKVQERAFRIIYPTTDYEDALNIAKCKRLVDRRQELCAKTLKRILKHDAHLNHLLPPLREESHELDLRNNSNFTLTKCARTERFKTSFIPAMTANFNSK